MKTNHSAPATALPRCSRGAVHAGLLLVAGALLLAGCVAHPGGVVVVNVGWRSAQTGSCTNILNEIEGGGTPNLEVHP